MTDPLSVTAGVVGLLATAAQVSLALSDIISRAKQAPAECKRLRNGVDDIRNVLTQLSQYTTGAKQASRSRRALIMVDQVAATLASSITTFDELKLFVEALQNDTKMGIMDRIRWLAKADDLKQLLARLETHKSSLTLMLTILTCQKQDDAEDKVDHLCDMIELMLKQNVIIAQRMAAYDMSQLGAGQAIVSSSISRRDTVVSTTPDTVGSTQTTAVGSGGAATDTFQRNSRGFAFEELLMNSRVYRSAANDNSDAFSVASSAGRTATWSMLSGLSLSEMSNIAILAIPVYQSDLSDKTIYDFEPPKTETTSPSVSTTSQGTASDQSESSKRKLKGWWKTFNRPSHAIPEIHEAKIFNTPLRVSIRYANVAISLSNEDGEAFIYGYVPIIVAKCSVFLKEKGTDVEDIFARSGHPKRVAILQTIFDSPERYGKGLDWTGYTVHDSAAILLRYLKSLPEPIIPYDYFEQAKSPLVALVASNGDSSAEEVAVKAYQKLITELPALNRQLLLYVLDTLAVFASKSDLNRMTALRLVSVMQPAILSRPPEQMDSDEHEIAVRVGVFLVDYQDNFLIGMSGTSTTANQKEAEEERKAPVEPEEKLAAKTRDSFEVAKDSLSDQPTRRESSMHENEANSTPKSETRDAGNTAISPTDQTTLVEDATPGSSSLQLSEQKSTIPSSINDSAQEMKRESIDISLPLRTLTAASSDDWDLWTQAQQRI